MSHQATAWVSEIRVGDPTLKSLLYAIAHRVDRTTWSCWPSLDCLAYDTEVSKRTIQRRLDELEALGFIRIEKRRRPDGTQDNSLLTITGGQIVTLSPPVDKNSLTGGQKQGSPVDTAVHHNKQEEQEEQKIRPAKQQDGTYLEEFEALWKIYPRTRNTSKKKAHDLWRMLNTENRERVRIAVPIFAASMRSERRPEDKIMHFQTFLSQRVYETVQQVAGSATNSSGGDDWYKSITPETWTKLLKIYVSTSNWSESWGPAPGRPGCYVPTDLIETLPFHLKPVVSQIVTPQPQRLLECDAPRSS